MGDLFFVSDVHFGLQEKPKEQEKIDLMMSLFDEVDQKGETLFLVGDILDYWMEYKHVVPKGHVHFFSGLSRLTKKGIQVVYLAGNHDFHLGSYFQEEFGVKPHYGMYEFEFNQNKFVLAHGDGIGKGDLGYKLFKTLIRNSFNLKLFKIFHPDLGVGLMNYLSKLSRKHTYSPTDYGENERLYIFANELLKNKKFDYFVCGHRHVPKLEKLSNHESYYVNCGTWIDSLPTYAQFNDDGMKLLNAINKEIVFSESTQQKLGKQSAVS